MGLRMGYGFAVTRKIGATEEIVQLVPVIAGGFALPKSQNPYQRPDDRYYRDYPGHRIAGSGEPESGEQYDPGNASADHGKIGLPSSPKARPAESSAALVSVKRSSCMAFIRIRTEGSGSRPASQRS